MWRSPSSPQIHQKYNYMWNNSYRTPTECWQKTSDFPKGKKLPTYLGGQKKKGKTETKEQGRGLHQWDGAVKEEMFPHTRKPIPWWRWGEWQGGKLQSHGGERSNRGSEGKAERFPQGDPCRPEPTRLRGLSAHTPGSAGAGS